MIKRQRICAITALSLFVVAAATVESKWYVSAMCVLGMALCILIGGLDRKCTSCDEVLKEHGIK